MLEAILQLCFQPDTMDRHHAMNATRVSYTLESTLASVNKAEQAAAEVAAKSGFDAGRLRPYRHGRA